MKSPQCPNCLKGTVANHPKNECVLNALLCVLRDRDELSERRIRTLHARCDVDALWADLGRIVDRLSNGIYEE